MLFSCSLSNHLRTFAVVVERSWPRFHIHHQLPEVYVLFGVFAVNFTLAVKLSLPANLPGTLRSGCRLHRKP